jgi:hypothetical protein
MKANQKLINRLALAPVRTCRTLHYCCLCGKDITYGNNYRDGGRDHRAHVTCFAEATKKPASKP